MQYTHTTFKYTPLPRMASILKDKCNSYRACFWCAFARTWRQFPN